MAGLSAIFLFHRIPLDSGRNGGGSAKTSKLSMSLKLEVVEEEGEACTSIALEDIPWQVPMDSVNICMKGKGLSFPFLLMHTTIWVGFGAQPMDKLGKFFGFQYTFIVYIHIPKIERDGG